MVDHGAHEAANAARDLVVLLEQRWSRFMETSEIAALNRTSGSITVVSEATYTLVSYAVHAQVATGGLFNPLMLRQLEHHGYRHPWNDGGPAPSDGPIEPACDQPIVLYPELQAVQLPAGTSFDPGGIGKGLAVDLAIILCQSMGATTASVELGGDIRVHGTPWYGPRWTIGVESPFDGCEDVATFTPIHGAVTTSTTAKRRWVDNERTMHHIIDPNTGYPVTTDIISVTTCSDSAWWAEVAAKSALIVGSKRAPELLRQFDTPGAIVTEDGRVETVGSQTPAVTAS